ncbi:MAG: efflux RND transporter permease subunit [Gemmatimonadetes bacterium]|nr:efflux RND transporter permease subunit [Gemmatimonadota bacterium]NNM06869.1 efflux RND transporter permease subunit [Gemmatimonadota bacterium]
MSIPSTSTRRPVAVAMLFLAVILLGIISFVRLPIDLLPDVSYPRLVVYTSYPDVAPAEVERLITERVEAQSAAVPGVERVTSVSREGVSLVTLRFGWGTDMDFAMLNVRERLDNIRESLPETASRPRILRVDPESEPILAIAVAGGADLWATKEAAESVFRRRLEQLDGVAEAAVTGGLDREIQVEVDPRLMDSYGLTFAEVANALARANISAPGGTILRGRYRYPLRTLGEFQTVEEIGDVVVGRQRATGTAAGEEGAFRLIRLQDIGQVVDGFAERESIARYNGEESVGVLVFKESGANTVQVAEDVEETLQQLREEYPDFALEIASSQAGFIADSISNVVQALVFGGILAFLVLFLFLRDPRYPVAIALAIPISVVGTFALMEAAGISLNIMSLGGLALGVGMLVDNSIVVLENIFRHRKEGGMDTIQSAAVGAEEVQRAITASTLTTISVFGPIVYVEGVAGELFGSLSLAVAFSLIASLIVALTLLPALAARWGRAKPAVAEAPPSDGTWGEGSYFGTALKTLRWIALSPFILLGAIWSTLKQLLSFWGEMLGGLLGGAFGPFIDRFDLWFDRFAVRYHEALEWSLDNRGSVVAMAGATLLGSVLLGMSLDRDLLPDVDQGSLEVRMELEEGTSLPATVGVADQVEATLLADPGVEAVFSRIGKDVRSYAESEEGSGVNTALFQVRLRPRARTEDVLERVRPLEENFPQGALTFEAGQATALGQILGGVDADIAVRVRGEDLARTFPMAELIRDRLAGIEEIGNVRVGTERGQPEIQVEILSEVAARYGIDPRTIAESLENAMRGDRATEFVDFDRKIGIIVRLPDELRYARETLEDLRVQGVPLRELVDIQEAVAPAEIRREDQGRVVVVYADVVSGGLDGAIAGVREVLREIPPDREIRMEVGGENEEMRRSFRDLAFAFGLALLLVYMILAAQFESFLHPFTILMAVPLAVVGAVVALLITGQGLNTMSLIGAVILVGIVVNDSIVKVDFINQARRQGMVLRDAILEAGRVRLRPIIMTTVTTVLGLTPMAMGLGRGADLRAPLAIAVIGGLIVATLLTLIVVPVVYSLVEGLKGGVVTMAKGPRGAETAAEGAD